MRNSGWRSNLVYTPEFVLNGREWQWSGTDTVARESNETPGALTVSQNRGGDDFVVTFNSTKPMTGQPIAHIAFLGFSVTSDVARGENAGRKLTHDFVVLVVTSPVSHLQGSSPRTEFKPDQNTGGPHSRALAAWVSVGSDPTPIQATGGWLSLQH